MDGRVGESSSEQLERELRRLADVSAVRVVSSEHDEPLEIHVLASPGRHAKQIVRDVEAVALAGFGMQIDRRIVSVVQLDQVETETIRVGAAPPAGPFAPNLPPAEPGATLPEAPQPAAPRPVTLVDLRTTVSGRRLLVEVLLEREDDPPVRGLARGSVSASALPRIIAAATVEALRKLDAALEGVDVEHARVVRMGDHDAAVVMLSVVDDESERLVAGAAPLHDEVDAIGRATATACIEAARPGRGENGVRPPVPGSDTPRDALDPGRRAPAPWRRTPPAPSSTGFGTGTRWADRPGAEGRLRG